MFKNKKFHHEPTHWLIAPGQAYAWEASWTRGNSSLIQRYRKLSDAVSRVVREPTHSDDTLTIKGRDGMVLWSGPIRECPFA